MANLRISSVYLVEYASLHVYSGLQTYKRILLKIGLHANLVAKFFSNNRDSVFCTH